MSSSSSGGDGFAQELKNSPQPQQGRSSTVPAKSTQAIPIQPGAAGASQ